MIRKKVEFMAKCDGWNCVEMERIFVINYIEELRFKGWAVSRNRKTCYCPNCKEFYAVAGTKKRWEKKTNEI